MDKEIALSSAMSVLERGSNFSIDNSEDFNRCFDHVMGLLKDAALLFKSGSYATSTFMSAAVMHTVAMGGRLVDALGDERIEELYELTYSGGLKRLREDALYWDIKNERIELPRDVVDRALARDLLLFSIEVFDDRLVGYTHYSIEASRTTDELFQEIADL